MLFGKYLRVSILQYVFFFFLTTSTDTCNIWKASDCPQPPTADDEEIFKYDLYTREQLYRFCDKGKRYVECVNERLQCCDLRSEHTGALAAYDVGLQQAGWRLGRHCAGLGGSSIIKYKCRTTTSSPTKTTGTTTTTTTTIPPCVVTEAGKECNEILGNRLHFEANWSVIEKIRWCKIVRTYVPCARKHIANCSIAEVLDDVEQLSNFIDFIIKQAELSCQGGFPGCEHALNDVRCKQSPEDFYNGVPFDSATQNLNFRWYLFFCPTILVVSIGR